MELELAQEGVTPDDQGQAKKPTAPNQLDSAGWLRLGQWASFTGQSLAQAPTNTNTKRASATVDNPGKQPGLLTLIAAQTVDRLKKEWQWFWHPIRSLRQWVAEVMAVQTPPDMRGTNPQPGQAPQGIDKSVTADKAPTPSIEDTWAQLKDRLFEAAANPQADPVQVVPSIIAGVPEEHRAAIAQRLFALSEMAQEAAKSVSQREMSGKSQNREKGNMPKGQDIPLPECPPETAIDIPEPDQAPRLKRQVPAQPVSPASESQRSRVEAEKAEKARLAAPNKEKAAQR